MSYFHTEHELLPKTQEHYTLWLVVEQKAATINGYYSFKERTFPNDDNAGFDLISMENSVDASGLRTSYLSDLGVRAVMTRGDVLSPDATVHYRLVPRSSIYKTGYMMANSEGIIDRTYRGILKAPVVAVTPRPVGLFAGDRHFQIVAPDLGWIRHVRIVDSLPTTQRGEGGFGSTGS